MSRSYGAGSPLCTDTTSGSAGSDNKIFDGDSEHIAFVQAIQWSGVGTLTLKTSLGNTFYSVTQASGNSIPVPILSGVAGLTVTTPILYTITGANKGAFVLFGNFI